MMARKLYALLVGIDEYPGRVPDLRGCENDIEAFAEYLQGQAAKGGFEKPHLHLLKSEAATRDAVIEGFREHLCQAGPDDIALFYYSGHGSQEQAPEEFWHLEPDRLNETLVCYDSREPGGWDLADKELAKLIHEVSQKNPHTVLILDCCHSGSGTRDGEMAGTAMRKLATDTRQRPLDSFIFDTAELASLSTRNVADGSGLSGWSLPEGRHILLAACQDNELAKEYNAEGKTWGTFSYFLRTTLQTTTRPLSYHELYSRARVRVEGSVNAQRPQLEASNLDDIHQPFLGGAVVPQRSLLVTPDSSGWILQAGAVHGIAAPTGTEATRLALFEEDSETLTDLTRTAAQAEVSEVSAQTSRLKLLEGDLDAAKTYQAVITGLPLPPLALRLEGDPTGTTLAREALSGAGPDGGASFYVTEADPPEYRLWAKDDGFTITRAADDRPLVKQVTGGYSTENAKKAVAQLEHIARWAKTRDLENPATYLNPNDVEMILHYDTTEYIDTSPKLSYQPENGSWKKPTFKLQLKNKSDKTLFCSVLALSESFDITAGLFRPAMVKLAPGEEAWAFGGNPIPATVPDDLWEAGITERKDILKLIFSTAAFDATLLQQGKLDAPRLRSGDIRANPTSALGRLMKRVQTRDFDLSGETTIDDWTSKTLTTLTVRSQKDTPVPNEGRSASLGFGVTIEPHPSLQARARLGTLTEASRNLDARVLPSILRDDAGISAPLQLTRSRGQDPGLSTLELSKVQNAEAVTKYTPLELTLDITLDEDEHLLPLAFDGEFYIPLGYAKPAEATTRGDAAGTKVVLERLPDPANLQTRDLFGAIRILFQKFKSKTLGKPFEYPLLTLAEALPDSEVNYDKSPDTIRTKVKDAERILLFVHGIIGETKPLIPSVRLAKLANDQSLQDTYDAVLAFDYENLHTPIEENARLLKERLESVGLGANHGKTLHIIAHSMGGLVSRWFVEREGGNKVVKHLVLVGTPSGGSPWSNIEDWALTMLGVGLNRLSAIVWPVALLARLVALLEKVDVSLDQMNPDSDFVKNLAASPDPGIPYTILAGNTSIIPTAQAGSEDSRLMKLLKKLKLKQRSYDALTQFVFKEDNDIAVGVRSIAAVDGNRTPAPVVLEVASDHVSYFRIDAGLEGLSQALGNTGETT